jgi:hypothetical protein
LYFLIFSIVPPGDEAVPPGDEVDPGDEVVPSGY